MISNRPEKYCARLCDSDVYCNAPRGILICFIQNLLRKRPARCLYKARSRRSKICQILRLSLRWTVPISGWHLILSKQVVTALGFTFLLVYVVLGCKPFLRIDMDNDAFHLAGFVQTQSTKYA